MKEPELDKKRLRLEALERQVERVRRKMNWMDARNNQFWQMKFAIFLFGILITVGALGIARWLGLICIVVAVALFFIVSHYHNKIKASVLKHRVWLQMQQTQIARITLNWSALPAAPERDEESRDHPFEIDLDITGERSLYQLMNTGVSFEGSALLYNWLLSETPDLDAIYRRQALVRELAPMSRFRNKLMLHSLFATRYSSQQLEGQRLLAWLKTSTQSISALTLIIPTLLSFCTLSLFALYLLGYGSIGFIFIPIALSLSWYLGTRGQRGNFAEDAAYLRRSFEQLQEIFTYLETYPYKKQQRLSTLCEPFFRHPDLRPSVLLKKLSGIASRAAISNSQEVALFINAVLPLDAYAAYQLSRYKEQITRALPAWLEAWFELEALCSLANFAYLNPGYVMPQVGPDKKQSSLILFQAVGLGHPLIQERDKVVNDFSLKNLGDVVMLTGSNMAGKSTFLRTIGINLCLAYAGAPVNATSLRAGLFEIYGCIKVSDSVIDGYSYFYAEVRRLKGLLNRLERGTRFPLFYLIDEIFKGTNNYERLIGSDAYIRTLIGKRCVGAISTHDLELVKLADEHPEIKNYHFREEVIDGKMVFDYKLRPGPCPTRNALKIMQMEGLPIS